MPKQMSPQPESQQDQPQSDNDNIIERLAAILNAKKEQKSEELLGAVAQKLDDLISLLTPKPESIQSVDEPIPSIVEEGLKEDGEKKKPIPWWRRPIW